MKNIRVLINGLYQSDIYMSNEKEFYFIHFHEMNTLSASQIAEVQSYFSSKYQNGAVVLLDEELYETSC